MLLTILGKCLRPAPIGCQEENRRKSNANECEGLKPKHKRKSYSEAFQILEIKIWQALAVGDACFVMVMIPFGYKAMWMDLLFCTCV